MRVELLILASLISSTGFAAGNLPILSCSTKIDAKTERGMPIYVAMQIAESEAINLKSGNPAAAVITFLMTADPKNPAAHKVQVNLVKDDDYYRLELGADEERLAFLDFSRISAFMRTKSIYNFTAKGKFFKNSDWDDISSVEMVCPIDRVMEVFK